MTDINYIFKKIRIGTVVKDGKEIGLSIATKTQAWTRTEVAKGQGWGFRAAVEKTLDQVASDTREICSRYRFSCRGNLARLLIDPAGKVSIPAQIHANTTPLLNSRRLLRMMTFRRTERSRILW